MCSTLRPANSWEALPLIDDLYFDAYANELGNNFCSMGPNAGLKQESLSSPSFGYYNFQSYTASNESSPATSSTPDSKTSSNNEALKKKQERDQNAPTTCSICGSPASCFHYGSSACNGCKTFFRRSIVLHKNYICKFDSKCDILNNARCRSCRYDRCLLAGMDASVIKFGDSETAAAVLNDVNKRKRALKVTDENAEKEALVIQTKIVPRFDQTSDSRVVDCLSYLEMKFRRLRESVFNDSSLYDLDIHDILKRRSELGNADKYAKPVWQTFEQYKHDPFALIPNGRHWLACDILLNVEFLKAMPFYHELDINDQEALCMHIILVNTVLVQSWYSYKQNSRVLVHPDGHGPLHMRKYAPISKIYPDIVPIELDNFSRNIDPIYRILPSDEEYCLLKAIIFCHSDTPGLSAHAQDILDKHREIYSSTLLRRMQASMGTLQGATKFAELIGLIQTLFHFAQKKRELHFFIKSIDCAARKRREPKILEWFVKNSSIF
ncbi:Transcription factor HNF-4-like protein [Aphelenchoides bicaudatus]|nr:Transcription factor HNF-4-like protein [Aphelenchoides bicaudatus]